MAKMQSDPITVDVVFNFQNESSLCQEILFYIKHLGNLEDYVCPLLVYSSNDGDKECRTVPAFPDHSSPVDSQSQLHQQRLATADDHRAPR